MKIIVLYLALFLVIYKGKFRRKKPSPNYDKDAKRFFEEYPNQTR